MKALANIGIFAFSILTAMGQTPNSAEFEVASVKRDSSRPTPLENMLGHDMNDNDKGFDGGPGTKSPDRINYHGVTLKALLARAYDVKVFQISGPSWLSTEKYVILANVPHGADADQLRLMLQKLLTERFELSLHHGTKVLPVYQLTTAINGPKVEPVAAGEAAVYKDEDERRAAVQMRLKSMLDSSKAEMEKREHGTKGNGFSLFRATAAELAQKLSSHLDRPVVDMTQLKGLYNFHLSWVEDAAQSPAIASPSPSGPSLFSAVQEQLGLKLIARKQEFNVLVVDNASKIPTSN